MRLTVPRAMMAGIGILILDLILYSWVLLAANSHEFLRYISLSAPGLAACVTAYLSSRQKLLVGMSMAVYGALGGMLSDPLYEYFGLYIDHVGTPLETFVIRLVYCSALAALGSVVGIVLSRIIHDKERNNDGGAARISYNSKF